MGNDIQNVVLKNTNTRIMEKLESDAIALPKGFNTLRFKQNALTVLQSQDLTKMRGKEFELATCIMKGAYLGLDFANKECYVITYGGRPEFMTDYKGEVKLALNYSARPLKNIYAQLVKEGEEFKVVTDGESKKVIHTQGITNKGIVGAYAVAIFQDGTTNVEIMAKDEIDHIRNKFSKQSRGKAWTDSYGEMCKKTVLRRLTKHIQLNFDSIEQQQAWNTTSDVNLDNRPEEKEQSIFDNAVDVDYQDTPFTEEG